MGEGQSRGRFGGASVGLRRLSNDNVDCGPVVWGLRRGYLSKSKTPSSKFTNYRLFKVCSLHLILGKYLLYMNVNIIDRTASLLYYSIIKMRELT